MAAATSANISGTMIASVSSGSTWDTTASCQQM